MSQVYLYLYLYSIAFPLRDRSCSNVCFPARQCARALADVAFLVSAAAATLLSDVARVRACPIRVVI